MDELTNTNPAEEAGQTPSQPETEMPEPTVTVDEPQSAPAVAEPVATAPVIDPIEKSPTIEELDQMENEYTPQERESMLKLYEETLADFVSGVVVTGKVLAINEKEVAVDIGFKSEGTIPIEEFPDPKEINVGDNIQVFIDNIE
ncbi:MAG TPA: S1 RNA-binding domain-containing protein, partial [bacterium]|nr:S1 RNA-binding domain-containing protein [bacterium]